MGRIILLTVLLAFAATWYADETAAKPLKPMQVAVACFLKGERISGFNKLCFYDCLGSEYAITIGSTSLCPLTVER